MMSVPDGCMLAGNSLCQSLRSGQPAWTAQVIELSIHVSNTSRSPANSLPPQFGHSLMRGLSSFGSTGTHDSSANTSSPHCLQYQTGIGVANTRCLLMTQSQSSDLAQSVRRVFM